MARSVLDFRPVAVDFDVFSGAEPSMRELVFKYYAAHLNEEVAISMARNYCDQIESFERDRKI